MTSNPNPVPGDASDPLAFVAGLADGSPIVARLDAPGAAHTLVVGTTGTGKTVWIRAMLERLMSRNSAEDLVLVLAGPELRDAFAGDPHVQGLEGFDGMVESIEAVGNLCRARRVPRAGGEGWPQPRLVLVIDDLCAFLCSGPDAAERCGTAVDRILAYGEAVGVHLAVACQRPAVERLGEGRMEHFGRAVVFQLEEPDHAAAVLGADAGAAEGLARWGEAVLQEGGRVTRIRPLPPVQGKRAGED